MFVRKLTANYVPGLTRVIAALGILATVLIVLGLAVDSGVFRCAMAFAGQKAELTDAEDDVALAKATAERTSKITEYGMTLALQGDVERAETVFMSLLSTSPKDPRALERSQDVNPGLSEQERSDGLARECSLRCSSRHFACGAKRFDPSRVQGSCSGGRESEGVAVRPDSTRAM